MNSVDVEPYTIPFTGNSYCGPAVLAYVLRSDPDSAAKLLREVSGRRAIMGVSNLHMRLALSVSGLKWEQVKLARAYSLRQWINELASSDEYIVNITGHFLVVHDGMYFDSKCHLGKPLSRCPYLGRRVKVVVRIVRTNS